MKEILLNIITEATQWEEQMSSFERTEITLNEARNNVIDRIYTKYCNTLTLLPANELQQCESSNFEVKKFNARS